MSPIIEVNVNQNKAFKAYFKAIPPIPDGLEIHFSLFPNPTSSELILQHDNKTLAKGCVFEIYDLNGRKIFVGDINAFELQTKINVSYLSPSLYFLRIKQKETSLEVIRFVKN